MQLKLYQDKNCREEHIDIYYAEMKPVIREVIAIVRQDKPCLEGVAEEERFFLNVEDIYYIDTVDKRTFAYTKDSVYQLHYSLSKLEEMLWDYGFVRISKSNLVNIFQIEKIKPEVNMRVSAYFDNGEKLYINRSYKGSFQAYLQKMKGMHGDETKKH